MSRSRNGFLSVSAALLAVGAAVPVALTSRPGVWVTIGPSDAVYPFFPLRTSSLYVPNEYVAAGRTTSLVLAGDCDNGHCRLYAGPAGGGLWRTDNALAGQPHWTYLSTPFE